MKTALITGVTIFEKLNNDCKFAVVVAKCNPILGNESYAFKKKVLVIIWRVREKVDKIACFFLEKTDKTSIVV